MKTIRVSDAVWKLFLREKHKIEKKTQKRISLEKAADKVIRRAATKKGLIKREIKSAAIWDE